MSLITAVTLYNLFVLVSMLFPTASVVPKYFLAVVEEITTEFGAFNASVEVPDITGSVKTLNIVESVKIEFCSLINCVPFLIKMGPLLKNLTYSSTCG